ncbi:MAG: hypothetical protein ABR969_01555 [Sedimentisphaerales bacterium]
MQIEDLRNRRTVDPDEIDEASSHPGEVVATLHRAGRASKFC